LLTVKKHTAVVLLLQQLSAVTKQSCAAANLVAKWPRLLREALPLSATTTWLTGALCGSTTLQQQQSRTGVREKDRGSQSCTHPPSSAIAILFLQQPRPYLQL
jgi:hypothetical protein